MGVFRNLSRRGVLLGGGAVLGSFLTLRFGPKTPTLDGTNSLVPDADATIMNDASELSPTKISAHTIIQENDEARIVAALRQEIDAAKAQNQSVSVGAARHSMGAHSLPLNGRAVTFDHNWVEPDIDQQTYRVGAGARWSDVIARLDAIGFSPNVMQSNSDFGIASTFCVNAHGWPVPYGPAGASVRSIKMLLADGRHVTCSRTENTELFEHSMGGYGLFGIITELELDMVPNVLLDAKYVEMPAEEYGLAMEKALNDDPNIQMAYGRLNVDRENFFNDALLITYTPSAEQSELPEVTGSGFVSKISRHIFRQQLGNEAAKNLRWGIETKIGPKINGATTRNILLNEPVVTLDDKDANRTDILHEYFVAPDRFGEFVAACRDVIPASYQELLNITLRYVMPDTESVLSYAPVPRIAAVMLFSQEMTARGEEDMRRMTEALIERVIAIGGSYYLPYRPHASVEQFVKAYPRAAEFVAAKRRYDPDLVFRNGFWDNYLADL